MKSSYSHRTSWLWAVPVMASALSFIFLSCAPRPATTSAPPFELTNQRGETVSLSEFKGRVVALTFLYSHCPDTCPLYIGKMHQALDMIPAAQDKTAFVIVTVDPDRDTIEELKTYTKGWPANWHFLWGTPGQIKTVWDNYGIFVQKEGPQPDSHADHTGYSVIHTAKVVLIDTKGNRATELKGNWEAPELAIKIEALTAGKTVSGPSLGQEAMSFLFNCGSVAFQNLGQAVTHAVVTLTVVGGLAAFLIKMWR